MRLARFMRCVGHSGMLVFCLAQTLGASAQPRELPPTKDAIHALFPHEQFVEWTSTPGDWNGDGIGDVAIVLAQMDGPVADPREMRVVVMAGTATGSYVPLSVSSSYCVAQKFYNLEAKGPSLFVTEVHRAEGDTLINRTLQFRFNAKRADLELVGREEISETYGKEHHRTSVNYVTGKAVQYDQVRGRARKEATSRFKPAPLARLNGFNCTTHSDGLPQ